jgi:hypothetical protein
VVPQYLIKDVYLIVPSQVMARGDFLRRLPDLAAPAVVSDQLLDLLEAAGDMYPLPAVETRQLHYPHILAQEVAHRHTVIGQRLLGTRRAPVQ